MRHILRFCLLFLSFAGFSQNFVWMQDVIFPFFAVKGNGAAVDPAGNIFLSGTYTGMFSHDCGFFIHKYDAQGTLLWADSSGQTFSTMSGGVATDQHGNAYISVEAGGSGTHPIRIGNTWYPQGYMYVVKYGPGGNIKWVKSKLGLTPRAMNKDNSGNIYITGTPPAFTIKYDTLGNELMHSAYGSISISLDQWGNIYIPGGKLNPQGNLVWNTMYVARNAADEFGNTYISDQGAYGESTLMKLNSSGQPVWSYSVPYWGSQAISYKNDFIFVTGMYGQQNTAYGMGLYKYDTNGNLLWSHLTPNDTTAQYHYYYRPAGSISFFQNSIYIAGWRQKQAAEAFLAKYIDNNLTTTVKQIDDLKTEIKIFPNPASNEFYLNYNSDTEIKYIRISDSMGREVYFKSVRENSQSVAERIELHEAAGIYFVEIKTQNNTERKKLILE